MRRDCRVWLTRVALAATFALGIVELAVAQKSELGKIEFPTSGSGEAQQHFLRGVAALHSFFYEEALAGFEEAAKADPGFSMAYWGQAMAHNHTLWGEQDEKAAREALKKIGDTSKLSVREHGFISAAGKLYGEGSKGSRDRAYSAAMEQLHRENPGDHEVAIFYALSLLGVADPADKSYRNQARAAALALDVFTQNPAHPGAAHFIIHAFDDPAHAILALPAARRYAAIAPEAHHARHMPSHIFIQLGMWPDAAASNESAWAASVAWADRKGLPAERRDLHSLHWLLYISTQQGRFARAAELLEQAVQMTGKSGRGAFYRAEMAACYILESERWSDAAVRLNAGAAAGQTETMHQHGAAGTPGARPHPPRSAMVEAFARGMASARTGSKAAGAYLKTLRQHRKLLLAAGDPYSAQIAEILELEIAAAQEAEKLRHDKAIALARKAVDVEEQLAPRSGPPEVLKPSHELAGEILLRAGKPAEAAALFEKSLLRQPNRARSLLGSARAAARQGNAVAAAAAYGKLLEVWKEADEKLPELAEAREYVRQQGVRAGKN